jgi:hypothetical protein
MRVAIALVALGLWLIAFHLADELLPPLEPATISRVVRGSVRR